MSEANRILGTLDTPMFFAYMAGDMSLSSLVSFNVQINDVPHTLSDSDTIITIGKKGRYLVDINAMIRANDATNNITVGLHVLLNGTSITTNNILRSNRHSWTTANYRVPLGTAGIFDFVVGDQLRVVFVGASTAQTLDAREENHTFIIEYLSPTPL